MRYSLILLSFIIRGNVCFMAINGKVTNKSLTEQVIFAFINIHIVLMNKNNDVIVNERSEKYGLVHKENYLK